MPRHFAGTAREQEAGAIVCLAWQYRHAHGRLTQVGIVDLVASERSDVSCDRIVQVSGERGIQSAHRAVIQLFYLLRHHWTSSDGAEAPMVIMHRQRCERRVPDIVNRCRRAHEISPLG